MSIDVRTGRAGIGKTSARQERAAVRTEILRLRQPRQLLAVVPIDHEGLFRDAQRTKMTAKQTVRDLNTAQRVCEQVELNHVPLITLSKYVSRCSWIPCSA